MFDKWQRCLSTVLIVAILATLVDNRSYNNGLIFYDAQAHNVFLPPTVSVSRGRGLASVKYSSKGSIWSTFGKPCDCSGVVCGCCAGIRVKQYDFDQKMCANVTFLAKKHEAILDVYLNKSPSARYGISARNPSPLCIPVMLPIPMAMCVQMSDIAIKGNNLHMCMDFVVRLATTDFFEMHFQCMQMGLDGLQYLDKNGKPVLPMGTKSQMVNNGQQSKEENQYDDENLPNENEIDSNENKVEQNDYEEEAEDEEEGQEPNEEATNDEVDTLSIVTAEIKDNKEENSDKAAEDADEEANKDVDDEVAKYAEDNDHAQNVIGMTMMDESATNMKNLTINETTNEKLDSKVTFAAMHEHDMHEMETVVNAATMSPMATATTISTTTSTTTATNTAGNNVEDVDAADKMTVAVTEKPNDLDANDDRDDDNNENEGEEQSEDEDDVAGNGDDEEDDDDDDDDDESEDEDSDEDDDADDDENEDENDDEHHVNDEANANEEEDNNAKDDAATKIITEISNSNAQLQPGTERNSLNATLSNQVAGISPLFLIASETSAATEENSSKRHLKLLNYRRARG